MSWTLESLARHQHIQQRLRAEIAEAYQSTGGTLKREDYDAMPLLNAVIKGQSRPLAYLTAIDACSLYRNDATPACSTNCNQNSRSR